LSTAVALALIADRAGLRDLCLLLTLIIPTVAGFLAFNFPFGRIFLGDAGAYMIGHTLVWIGIALVALSQDVSPFAVLLVFFWPVADTGLAIYRRKSAGRRSDQPDRLHFHQLMLRYLEIRFLGRGRRRLANPLATLCLAPLIIAPQILGVLFAFDNRLAAASALGATVVFAFSYTLGVRSARELSRRRAVGADAAATTPAE
jgi:UDP-N-acetylmuramyl pentapeptide phosphotransferase/UDP-N-acetylglucosamine-1-phosphate transferase